MKRLNGLAKTDPKTAERVLDQGRIVSEATGVAIRGAISTGVGISSGGNTGDCFWDPQNGACWNSCNPYWNWWCSPGWNCWWTSCCYPWWGWGWGFGYWSGNWGIGFGYYGSSWCAPYPAYYSSVIYDTYAPPVETVYVEQPVAAPAEEVVAGEGSIGVPGQGRVGAAPLAAVSQELEEGDKAFREGRYGDAVHFYAKAVEMAPGEGVLHLILSDALFATGDYHYAAYALRRALELDATLVESVVDKHSFYGDPSEFDRQLDLLERYLEDHFLDDDARLLLGANYLFGSRPAQSVDLLQSPFSVSVRESAAGRVLLERASQLVGEKKSAQDAAK